MSHPSSTGIRSRHRAWAAGPAAALVLAGALTAVSLASASAAHSQGATRAACAAAPVGQARCLASYVVPNADGSLDKAAAASAVTPADLQGAYDLPIARGTGMTVAIVDAFDNPKAERDLRTFRSKYGLPACTTSNGCFRKVNQNGDPSPLPHSDPDWGLEIALDLDAVSSTCPRCKILLVEGRSPTLANLGKAVNTAVLLGADVVSNSYGTDEFAGMDDFGRRYYDHPGVAILASTGDFGFGPASFPAVLRGVVAAGGTRLTDAPSADRGWTEQVWRGAGSGCSAYVRKPAWQHDTHCSMRTVGDLSADADPATGLLVEDSFGFPGTVQVGGTSLSSPLLAGMFALTGDTSGIDNASGLYAATTGFYDVVGGHNGFCGHDYLCTGVRGYDAPSGVGTPDGISALS